MRRLVVALLLAAAPLAAAYPQVRGFSIFNSSLGSVPVSWPSGTIAGDLAIIFAAGPNNFFNPFVGDGWQACGSAKTGSFIGADCLWRILDSTDIATGSYTMSPNGANPNTYAIVTIKKTTFDAVSTVRESPAGRDTPAITSVTISTSSAVTNTDLAVQFGGIKSGAATGISPGTVLGTVVDPYIAGNIGTYEVPSNGVLATTFSYGSITSGSGDWQCVVIVESGGAPGSNTFSIIY